MDSRNEDINTKVTQEDTTEKRKRKAIPIFLFFLFIFIIIIIIFLLYYFRSKKDNTSNQNSTENTQNQDLETTKTESEDTPIADTTPSCAPVYTGGKIKSSTSTDTTWSFYFTDATSESVSGYVDNLKSNGWSTISEKVIANTSFWDLQNENCYVSLRYHSPDNGVILEIKEDSN